MDLEGGVTSALNIKRTKVGQADKEWAYIVTKDKAMKAIAMVLALICILCYLLFSTEMAFVRQTKLAHDVKVAGHDSDVSLLSISAELEAHLAQEAEWARMEDRLFEREKELLEGMRGIVGQELAKLFHELDGKVKSHKALAQAPAADQHEFLQLVSAHQKSVNTILNKHLDKLTAEVDSLAKVYQEKAAAQSTQARDRLHSLHRSIQHVIKKVDKQEKEPEWSESEVDEELHQALEHFFENADSYAKQTKIELPKDVEEQVREFHKNFELYNAGEVIERLNKRLLPEGGEHAQYGAWLYKDGSVEEYLDALLFAAQFRRTGYPEVMRLRREWEEKIQSNVELLNHLMDRIERKGPHDYDYLPPEWFIAGEH